MFKVKMESIVSLVLATALVAVMGITACSSSGGDDNGGAPASASAVSIGTMTKGSVIVNGVTFEDNAARITGDDTAKVAADLKTGMTVRVRGAVNDDGVSGTAERIEIENEVRGLVTVKGADTLTVNAQTVLVDGGTIFAGGITGLAGLTANADSVEVHGQRDQAGVIRATRVERLGAGDVDDEVRGIVSNLAGNLEPGDTFTIGALQVSTSATTSITPAGATIANGTFVEVHLNGAVASRVHAEDDDDEFEPAEGAEFEVEGFVSGCTANSPCGSSFKVNNQSVQTSSSTRFEGGVKNDLVNDMKVEAEGHLTGGILAANKIALKETVRLESNATTTGSANVLGKTVLVTSKTEFSSNLTSTAGIAAGNGIRIRGFVNKNSDGSDADSITATRVEKQSNPVDADKNIVRGPVKNINATSRTFTIVGITINAGASAARPDDDSGSSSQTMSLDSFFSSLVDGRTIVKARGTFDSGANTIAADEIEIE